ncbi:MAG: hypothetical protein JST11_01050 [Acidobacteria bacterium]|nr:hypothetical protein [Acidobacteriota bacterium]
MRTIWPRLLERLATGDPVVGIDEMRRWGRLEFERAIGVGILRETEPARWIMCDFCPDRHWSEVITVAGGRRMFISCPEEGSVNIEAQRLRQWRIDAGRVGELAGAALDLAPPTEVLLLQHLWRLGRRRLGGRYRDIFLGVDGGPALSEMFMAIRRSMGEAPALILTVGCEGGQTELPRNHDVIALASVSRIEGDRIVVDLDYLHDRFAEVESAPPRAAMSIPAAAGATWADVSIVVCDDSLRIGLGGKWHDLGFAGIGTDRDAQPIELLRLFAAARGTLDATTARSAVTGDTPMKTRLLRLRQVLQSLIDIDGPPIRVTKKTQTYICEFEIRLDRENGFPTPAGVSWLDFSFHERSDGRLAVSVSEPRRFRAHGPDTNGNRRAEVAEESGTVVRTYSLEDLGFRGASGRLSEEGSIFIRMLRGAGSVARRGDDLVVLRLAKQLREWTGLDGEPLRLVEASACWTAVFPCSSDNARQRR